MQSQFVILAYMDLETPLSRTSQCLLNLLEMWMACIPNPDRERPPHIPMCFGVNNIA
jgi:hypothetical protein